MTTDEIQKFYQMLRKLQESVGKCLMPYPRSLLRHTKIAAYRKVHEAAVKIARGSPKDSPVSKLPLWTEYLLKFKQLYDDYQKGKAGKKEIYEFLCWCRELKNNVLVIDKVERLLGAWMKCVENGAEWIHFNLDWEDGYIRRHDTAH